MFEQKQTALLNVEPKENQFLRKALQISSESANGAKKYSTSGNAFVDDFAAIATYKEPRPYSEVAQTMSTLWKKNPTNCVKLLLYIRLVTRKTKLVTKNKVEELEIQRGQGLRHESQLRMLWLAVNRPETFKANFPLFIVAGSWKDVITLLSLDLQYNGWNERKLDWNYLFKVIQAGLINPETTHLVRKYLPTIRTNKKCTTLEAQADTIIGRWIANRMFTDTTAYKAYRKMKSEGLAHQWQQLISKQLYDAINFNNIAGRALMLLVGGKFFENHPDIAKKYAEWVSKRKTVKFTGYVYELFTNVSYSLPQYKIDTINNQFNKLVEKFESSLLVVCDTSASMGAKAIGCNVSSNCISKSLALYFSYSLKGKFANAFAEFDDKCTLHYWEGETPVDKYLNNRCEAYGSTNFQSVIDMFINIKNEGVAESEFPSGILAISDGELNACGNTTNFALALKRLREAGFSEEYVSNFKIILWDIPNDYYYDGNKATFESFADAPNFFYMSGYDGSNVAFILEGKTPKNAEELLEAALNQDLLNRVRIIKPKRK